MGDASVPLSIARFVVAKNDLKLSQRSKRNDCGILALATLFNLTYEHVESLMTSPEAGTSFTDLWRVALTQGYAFAYFACEDDPDFEDHVKAGAGLVARVNPGGLWHICASDGTFVYDPVFSEPCFLKSWSAQECFLLLKIKSF